MSQTPLALAAINNFDRTTFIATLGAVFEGSPWIAAAAWQERPWSSIDALHRSLCTAMYDASLDQKLALIRAHPDLVGRAAQAGTLTPASTQEQAAAGLDRLTPEEVALFNDFNARYRQRFGFPFVICARENRKASILVGFQERLEHSQSAEILTALDEIAKIARLRLLDIIQG